MKHNAHNDNENIKTELKKNQMKWQEEMKQTIADIKPMMEQENPTNIEETLLKMKEEFQIQTQVNDKEWERRLEAQKLSDEAWDRRINDQHKNDNDSNGKDYGTIFHNDREQGKQKYKNKNKTRHTRR